MSLRIIVVLEKFAIDCAHAIWSRDLHDETYEKKTFPKLLPYPADSDWRVLDIKLTARILTFSQQIEFARDSIEFSWNVGGPDSADDELLAQVARCGHLAWALARELRKKHGVATYAHADWSHKVAATLKKHHDESSQGASQA